MVNRVSSPQRTIPLDEIHNLAVTDAVVDPAAEVCRKSQEQQFSVDLEGRVIHLSKDAYGQSDKLLLAALKFFPAHCYVKLDPFQCGSLFFCYKNSTEQVQGCILDKESCSPLDLQNLHTLDSIQSNASYEKIKVEYDLKVSSLQKFH